MAESFDVAGWVEASCAAQGVEVKIDDLAVLRRIGVLLGADEGGAGAPSGASAPPSSGAYSRQTGSTLLGSNGRRPGEPGLTTA